MIEKDFLDYLVSLNTPAEDRVFPIIVPQGVVFPAMSFKSVKNREQDQADLTGDYTATFVIKCEVMGRSSIQTYWDCKAFVNSLVSGLNSYSNGTITGVYSLLVGEESDEDFYFLDGNTYGIQPITLQTTIYFRGV